MSQPFIVVTGRIPEPGLDLLRTAGEVVAWPSDTPATVAEVHAAVAGAHAAVTLLTTKVDDAFLDAAGPQLKKIGRAHV